MFYKEKKIHPPKKKIRVQIFTWKFCKFFFWVQNSQNYWNLDILSETYLKNENDSNTFWYHFCTPLVCTTKLNSESLWLLCMLEIWHLKLNEFSLFLHIFSKNFLIFCHKSTRQIVLIFLFYRNVVLTSTYRLQ